MTSGFTSLDTKPRHCQRWGGGIRMSGMTPKAQNDKQMCARRAPLSCPVPADQRDRIIAGGRRLQHVYSGRHESQQRRSVSSAVCASSLLRHWDNCCCACLSANTRRRVSGKISCARLLGDFREEAASSSPQIGVTDQRTDHRSASLLSVAAVPAAAAGARQ